jgi:hypothetical protein
MARANGPTFARSLDRLSRATELALRLADLSVGDTGRVNAVCERLRRVQSELDAHRNSQPLEKRRALRLGDEIIAALVELLTIVEAEEKKRK